jgi:hypothetical protein
MGSLKLRTAILLWSALIAAAAFGASGAMAAGGSTPKKAPVKVAAEAPALCALGQTSTAALKCTANPTFGKDGCTQLIPSIQAIIGTVPTATVNKAATSGIDCYYIVGSKIQAFGVEMFDNPTMKSVYQQTYQGDVSTATSLSCDNNNGTSFPPANPPQTLTGLGDEAFSWDQCTPHGTNDNTSVTALNGNAYYSVYSQHPYTEASVSQLVGLIRQLMTKYP